MTDLYRIDKTKNIGAPDPLRSLIEGGVLVPDTTVQAIADAYRTVLETGKTKWQFPEVSAKARLRFAKLMEALIEEEKR